MKKRSIILLGTLALLGCFLASAQAQRKPWQRRPGIVLYKLKSQAASTHHRALASLYRVRAGQDEEAAAAELMQSGSVEYAEPDYLMPVAALPNDPGFASQWYHQAVHSEAAWDITTGTGSVVVAVCDTGVDAAHPDLAANISLPGYNSANGTTNTNPVFEHGTAVAGIIGAVGNNATGGTGIAWHVKLLPVRVSDNVDGSAWCSDMAAGIQWAADHGASVINLSYDITGCPRTIDSAAQYAEAKGAVTFVAAGNGALNLSATSFPATHTFILVGATDSSGQRASFSNFGRPIDLVAPGVSIYAPVPGNIYAAGSGTSFATPMASGAAALLFSMSPEWTPGQIKQFLLATARPDSMLDGYGRLDASAALNAAKTVLAGGPPPDLPETSGLGTNSGLADLNSMLVFPNPWRADRHGAGVPIVFNDATDDSTVKIFTLSGYLIRTLMPSAEKASWDLKNDSGEMSASGIYLYSVTDSRGRQSQGKLAIIR